MLFGSSDFSTLLHFLKFLKTWFLGEFYYLLNSSLVYLPSKWSLEVEIWYVERIWNPDMSFGGFDFLASFLLFFSVCPSHISSPIQTKKLKFDTTKFSMGLQMSLLQISGTHYNIYLYLTHCSRKTISESSSFLFHKWAIQICLLFYENQAQIKSQVFFFLQDT